MTMFNFIWLDIDSSWQNSDSKWLDSFCDLTLTRLDQVMTRLWLDSKKIQMTLTRLWLEGLVTRLDSWLDKYDSSTSLSFIYKRFLSFCFVTLLFCSHWKLLPLLLQTSLPTPPTESSPGIFSFLHYPTVQMLQAGFACNNFTVQKTGLLKYSQAWNS